MHQNVDFHTHMCVIGIIMPTKKEHTVNLRLTLDQYNYIKQAAEKENRSVANWMRTHIIKLAGGTSPHQSGTSPHQTSSSSPQGRALEGASEYTTPVQKRITELPPDVDIATRKRLLHEEDERLYAERTRAEAKRRAELMEQVRYESDPAYRAEVDAAKRDGRPPPMPPGDY